jgi:hypothetical protein
MWHVSGLRLVSPAGLVSRHDVKPGRRDQLAAGNSPYSESIRRAFVARLGCGDRLTHTIKAQAAQWMIASALNPEIFR